MLSLSKQWVGFFNGLLSPAPARWSPTRLMPRCPNCRNTSPESFSW